MNQNDPNRLSRQEVSESTTTGGVDPEAKGPNSYSSGSCFYCWMHGLFFLLLGVFPVHDAFVSVVAKPPF